MFPSSLSIVWLHIWPDGIGQIISNMFTGAAMAFHNMAHETTFKLSMWHEAVFECPAVEESNSIILDPTSIFLI